MSKGKMSREGLQLIMDSEGLELTAYPDPGTKNDPIKKGHPWTIGYGHTNGVIAGMTCTKAQAVAWLKEDVSWAEDAINKYVKVPLDQSQFDALVDFVYNVGIRNLLKSELLMKLNQGRYGDVDGELMEWNKANGKVLNGLTKRRARAAELFDDHAPKPGEAV